MVSNKTTTTTIHKSPKILDVLIVGGGLSGLLVGRGLHRWSPALAANHSPPTWKLLEARPVLGGRLANDQADKRIDLGGAWIWPTHQPHMKDLIQQLSVNDCQPQGLSSIRPKLRTFPQPDEPSSTRVDGGAVQLIHAIAYDLHEHIQLESPVKRCTLVPTTACTDGATDRSTTAHCGRHVRVETMDNEIILANRVVFAVPPKLVSRHIVFDPPLDSAKQAAMAASHTWMAGVTKIALVYPHRFWKPDASNMGLPSDTKSNPAFQVYDSSTLDGSVAALTFFALVHPNNRLALNDDAILAEQVASQMASVWRQMGRIPTAAQSHSYTSHHVVRWPSENYIAEDDRPTKIHPHPYPVRALAEPAWDGLLQFAGSETDLSSPGVMEGAVGAAKRVLQALEKSLANTVASRGGITDTAKDSASPQQCSAT